MRGTKQDMRVALVGRTVILAGWLLAVVWHGVDEAMGILLALTLVAVWAIALLRDRRRGRPVGNPRPL